MPVDGCSNETLPEPEQLRPASWETQTQTDANLHTKSTQGL